MFNSKNFLSVVVIAMAFGHVVAQGQENDLETEMRMMDAQREQQEMQLEAEMRRADEERRAAEINMERAVEQMSQAAMQHREAMAARSHSDRSVEVEIRMKDAEQALAEAAQEMTQLSIRQLPRVRTVQRIVRSNRGPVLGVSIGGEHDGSPVEGVNIIGVSPGGAADEAGLQAGDVITAINNESLTADNDEHANLKLLDFMQGVEEGDVLIVEYLRDGDSITAELEPKAMNSQAFSFSFDSEDFAAPNVHVSTEAGSVNRFLWASGRSGFGDMELVKLTEELGNYFGTAEGLLVVRAPENDELKLMDGDVIQSIDGREPKSASHAMRILGSYESGETLKIDIMRSKSKQSVSIDVPENTNSWASPTAPMAPGVTVMPRGVVVVPAEDEN